MIVPDALGKIFNGPVVYVGSVLSLPSEVLCEVLGVIANVRDILS